ncbi:branched-chain amino acid ABC transporter permease [Variovorax sp. E3]|uniref:branched-chain amino acid ABC transporter permease n=1 Tax=Variovorax sp. E3 TaxID=1914993 RepID=UPI0018DB8ABD|nr:branched-chain amino acid ABC transporter permease [Variovorax sp. E3]
MKKYLPVIVLASVALFVPAVIESPFVLHSVVMILLYAYLSTSWNIVGGFAGQLSLGHSSFMAIGGYTSTLLALHFGLSPWIGMIVGAFAAAFMAVMIGIPSFRLKGAYYSLATIAFAEALSMLLQTVKEIGPVDLGGAEGLRVPMIPDAGLWDFQFLSKVPYYYIILAFLAIVLLVCWYIDRSKLGYYLTAIKEDEDAAKALGINTARTKLVAAGVSAFFTAIGGTFFVQLIRYAEPANIAGIDLSVQMVFLAVVGGLGTVFGPLVGSIVLTTLATITQLYLGSSSSGLHLIIYGLAVVSVILFMPPGQGIIHPILRLLGLGPQTSAATKETVAPSQSSTKVAGVAE